MVPVVIGRLGLFLSGLNPTLQASGEDVENFNLENGSNIEEDFGGREHAWCA